MQSPKSRVPQLGADYVTQTRVLVSGTYISVQFGYFVKFLYDFRPK